MSRRIAGGIVLLVSVALPVALLSACTPPMPPDVLAARAESQIECQSGALDVSVPEAFAGAISAVGAALQVVCPNQITNEVGATDPAPVALIDQAPDAALIQTFAQERCQGAPALAIPAFAYPVAFAYNVIGVEGLIITPQAMAGILSGQVTSFEDPLITEPNTGYDLSGLPPIRVLGLDQPQAVVSAMTAWLAKEAPDAWTLGSVGVLPAAEALPSTADLLGELTASEATVAILPTFEAINNLVPTASLPITGTDPNGLAFDLVVSAGDVQLAQVGSGAATVTTDETGNILVGPAIGGVPSLEVFDPIAAKIVLAEDQPLAGWPVVAYAHLLVCDSVSDPLPRSFAQYLVRLAGQGSLATFGVTPLPEPIRVQTFIPLRVTVATDEPSPSSTT